MTSSVLVQTSMFEDEPIKVGKSTQDSTFVDNMRLPVHRWFRYSAGFSARWVQQVATAEATGSGIVFDPFAGSGTTLIAAEMAGLPALGLEPHPFVSRVAQAKLGYRSDPKAFLERARQVRARADEITGRVDGYPSLIQRIFNESSLMELDSLRRAHLELADESVESQLVWLCLVSILRQVSHVGTAPWQYVLPKKSKKFVDPFPAFQAMTQMISSDMSAVGNVDGPHAKLIPGDARTCDGISEDSVSLVITSPPYPNNYDYADATRIEMSFLCEIDGWGDLQDKVRSRLMRSCTQHVPESSIKLEGCIDRDELIPIREEIWNVCDQLAETRKSRGGKKTYHLMVAAYFLDIAQVWHSLRRVCRPGARVCFVIGDSAPYGIYVPVIDWMTQLAYSAGFKLARFEKLRDRNTKWKNRKHQVPLVEGRLWLEG